MKITFKNRWLVIVGGILIQLCLGIIYAWSVFTVPLTKAVEEGGKGFTASQSAWIFSIGLFTFSVFMIVSGKLMERKVPTKRLAAIGGLFLGLGYILAGNLGGSFMSMLLSIGILGGAGIGLAYAVPLKIGISWYPDKVGLVSGLAVAGFGFGATFWIKAAGAWFGGGLLQNLTLFGLPGLESTFVLYGIILVGFVLLGSITMTLPPEGYLPEGWNPKTDALDPELESVDIHGTAMLRTGQFRLLFSMFLLSAFAGLMVIYCIKLFGIDALSGKSGAAQASVTAGTAMAIYAIMNGLGRILYGRWSDSLGRKKTLRIMMLTQAVMMTAFFWLGQSAVGLMIGAAIIGLNFGGNFALFPAATAVYFGKKNIGENYGWVFLSYGFAGILGPLLAGVVKDIGSETGIDFWLIPFLAAAGACMLAMILTFFLKKPKVTS